MCLGGRSSRWEESPACRIIKDPLDALLQKYHDNEGLWHVAVTYISRFLHAN